MELSGAAKWRAVERSRGPSCGPRPGAAWELSGAAKWRALSRCWSSPSSAPGSVPAVRPGAAWELFVALAWPLSTPTASARTPDRCWRRPEARRRHHGRRPRGRARRAVGPPDMEVRRLHARADRRAPRRRYRRRHRHPAHARQLTFRGRSTRPSDRPYLVGPRVPWSRPAGVGLGGTQPLSSRRRDGARRRLPRTPADRTRGPALKVDEDGGEEPVHPSVHGLCAAQGDPPRSRRPRSSLSGISSRTTTAAGPP